SADIRGKDERKGVDHARDATGVRSTASNERGAGPKEKPPSERSDTLERRHHGQRPRRSLDPEYLRRRPTVNGSRGPDFVDFPSGFAHRTHRPVPV
ncbi:MAG: hypothetical protein KGR22_08270, partial [Planctomycetes bacterium]|nr:hypothetical protein [Planctomycetota bacterium]